MSKRKGLCDSFCKGCVYNQHGASDRITLCTYYLDTDNRRPCPAGEGCTVKRTGKKQGMWQDEREEAWKRRTQNISKEVLHRVCACGCGAEFDTTDKRKIFFSRKCSNKAQQRAHHKRKKENIDA
jgi:hypothetical protein